jgi:hydrogenase 3 maturation protease
LKSSNDSAGEAVGLAAEIRNRLKGKVAIVAVGNIMRSDDGLGSKFIELLKTLPVNARLFDCGTAPENYIFPILSAACDTIVLVDAADLGMAPGEAKVLELDQIMNVSFSTHSPSPRLFTDLLKTGKEDLNIFIVSVQPKSTALGGPMSDEVLKGLGVLAGIFSEILA